MDIFTTQLTRVVPVPIKPANLKVKALLKDAANAKLKEDHDHLENHDYYFDKGKNEEKEKGDQYHANHQEKGDLNPTDDNEPLKQAFANKDKEQKSEQKKTIGKDKHLDLYA